MMLFLTYLMVVLSGSQWFSMVLVSSQLFLYVLCGSCGSHRFWFSVCTMTAAKNLHLV